MAYFVSHSVFIYIFMYCTHKMIGMPNIRTSKRSIVRTKDHRNSIRNEHTHNSNNLLDMNVVYIFGLQNQPRWWWHAMTQFHYNNVQEHVTNFRSNGATTTAYLLFSANNAMNASTNISMSHVTNPLTKWDRPTNRPTDRIEAISYSFHNEICWGKTFSPSLFLLFTSSLILSFMVSLSLVLQ